MSPQHYTLFNHSCGWWAGGWGVESLSNYLYEQLNTRAVDVLSCTPCEVVRRGEEGGQSRADEYCEANNRTSVL